MGNFVILFSNKVKSIKIAKKKSSIKKTYQSACQALISELISDEDIKQVNHIGVLVIGQMCLQMILLEFQFLLPHVQPFAGRQRT